MSGVIIAVSQEIILSFWVLSIWCDIHLFWRFEKVLQKLSSCGLNLNILINIYPWLQGTSGGNASNNNRNSEGLEYDLDALDNFPDPSPGDFDPSNSLSSSFPPMDSHPGNISIQ